MVGVERGHIAMIESGAIKEPRPELREKLALALGGEPEPVGDVPLTGARARLVGAVQDLTEEEAEVLLRVADLLLRKGRGSWE